MALAFACGFARTNFGFYISTVITFQFLYVYPQSTLKDRHMSRTFLRKALQLEHFFLFLQKNSMMLRSFWS